uniref:Uncharacterized protein n=1 Tax=Anguilla anguilla TaxID=7936 RepID=A0A0E9V0K7_ANGAN
MLNALMLQSEPFLNQSCFACYRCCKAPAMNVLLQMFLKVNDT